jgi:putative NADH-flavin reductase
MVMVLTCDKAMSNLLESKPVDGLRLSQATWSKSENLLRNSSQVLASAENYLSTTGAFLQDLEGERIAEIKSLLLQLDKALGTSQVLVSGALASLTLSKRSEILDKSSVNETLKDSLMKSPLTDKIFGLEPNF